jgi:hypothetical protein
VCLPACPAGEEGDRTPISAAVAMCNPFNLVRPPAHPPVACWLLLLAGPPGCFGCALGPGGKQAARWGCCNHLHRPAGAAASAWRISAAVPTRALPAHCPPLQPMSDTNFQKGFNKIYDWNLVSFSP